MFVPLCKEVRSFTLKNEGTVAIRHQWLRCPPTRASRKILSRPGCVINTQKFQPPGDDAFFWKEDSFEFHFRELPGVILPGQAAQVTVIFRPRRNGYFYENMFLLTHPRLSDKDDKIVKIRLSGICMNPECPLPHSKDSKNFKFRKYPTIATQQKVLTKIRSKMLFYEADDALNAILDDLLYNRPSPTSTLPLGKVIAEEIFHWHNLNFRYKYGVAETSLELVRGLARDLITKDVIMKSANMCPLSIPKLYAAISKVPLESEYFWSNFKRPEMELQLEKLSKGMKDLAKPRVFSWSNISCRLYSICYNTMVSSVDDVVARTANIVRDCKNKPREQILALGLRNKLLKKKQNEQRCRLRAAGIFFDAKQEPQGYYSRSDNLEYDGEENDSWSKPVLPELVITDEEIASELEVWRAVQGKESKIVLFETLFGDTIERMMSVVDTYRATIDYGESHGIVSCDAFVCSN